MFIGHVAVGFAAKRAVPRVSLSALIFAAMFADALWPVLVLTGFEHVLIVPGATAYTPMTFVSYPWSHSLVMLAVWGACIGGAYRGIFGGRRSFVALATIVISHWVLDWVTHAPDMPLYPGSTTVGLGLWNSVPATVAVELLLFAAGVFLYARTTRAVDAVGQWAFIAFVVVLTVLFLADALTSAPPPSITVLCVTALVASVIFPVWAWWADRHREARRPAIR